MGLEVRVEVWVVDWMEWRGRGCGVGVEAGSGGGGGGRGGEERSDGLTAG